MSKLIYTKKNVSIIVDDSFTIPDGFTISISSHGYAFMQKYIPYGKYERIYLHRYIMNEPKNLLVDHANGDKLDNRVCNLRVCSVAENVRNSKPPMGRKFKGVSFDKRRKMFRSYIVVNNKQKHLGYFNDEVSASIAYNNAATLYYGEFARLNG